MADTPITKADPATRQKDFAAQAQRASTQITTLKNVEIVAQTSGIQKYPQADKDYKLKIDDKDNKLTFIEVLAGEAGVRVRAEYREQMNAALGNKVKSNTDKAKANTLLNQTIPKAILAKMHNPDFREEMKKKFEALDTNPDKKPANTGTAEEQDKAWNSRTIDISQSAQAKIAALRNEFSDLIDAIEGGGVRQASAADNQKPIESLQNIAKAAAKGLNK